MFNFKTFQRLWPVANFIKISKYFGSGIDNLTPTPPPCSAAHSLQISQYNNKSSFNYNLENRTVVTKEYKNTKQVELQQIYTDTFCQLLSHTSQDFQFETEQIWDLKNLCRPVAVHGSKTPSTSDQHSIADYLERYRVYIPVHINPFLPEFFCNFI